MTNTDFNNYLFLSKATLVFYKNSILSEKYLYNLLVNKVKILYDMDDFDKNKLFDLKIKQLYLINDSNINTYHIRVFYELYRCADLIFTIKDDLITCNKSRFFSPDEIYNYNLKNVLRLKKLNNLKNERYKLL